MQQQERVEKLIELFKELNLVSYDLIPIITGYEKEVQYSPHPTETWTQRGQPRGIISDQRLIYFCNWTLHCLCVYDLVGNKDERKLPTFTYPSDLDFYQNCLYVIDQQKIFVFDRQLQLLHSFPIPHSSRAYNHLKVNQNLIYVTIDGLHQLHTFTSEGKLKSTIGSTTASTRPGEFTDPRGLTADDTTLYICDCYNHRIQSLTKNSYSFRKQWGTKGAANGQFDFPYSIFYLEDVLYVGDFSSVQLFTCEGTFVQKLGNKKGNGPGQFGCVRGVCVVRDRLYVCDYFNKRIQVFE